jgi:hypothetical protein
MANSDTDNVVKEFIEETCKSICLNINISNSCRYIGIEWWKKLCDKVYEKIGSKCIETCIELFQEWCGKESGKNG